MLKCFIRNVAKSFQLLLVMGGIMLLLTGEYYAANYITVAAKYVLKVAVMNNAGLVPWLGVIGILFGIPGALIGIGIFFYETFTKRVNGVKNVVDTLKEVAVSIILGALFGLNCYAVYGLNYWFWYSYNQFLLWPEVEVTGKMVIALVVAFLFVVVLLASALTLYVAAKQKKKRSLNAGGQSTP